MLHFGSESVFMTRKWKCVVYLYMKNVKQCLNGDESIRRVASDLGTGDCRGLETKSVRNWELGVPTITNKEVSRQYGKNEYEKTLED